MNSTANDLAEDVCQQVFALLAAPLFRTPLAPRIVTWPGWSLVVADLPVLGWQPPLFQEDEQTWALAVDYPLNGRKALAANGATFNEAKKESAVPATLFYQIGFIPRKHPRRIVWNWLALPCSV